MPGSCFCFCILVLFSGNADGILPITSTRHDLNALNLPKKGPWSAWYDGGEVKLFFFFFILF